MALGKRGVVLGLLLLSVAVLSGIAYQRSRASELIVATVVADWFNAPLTFAVNDSDLLKDVTIGTVDFSSGLASKTSVLRGNADVGLAAFPPLIRDPAALNDILILACYMRSDNAVGIATKKSAAPLEEKIGVVLGTISEIYLAQYVQNSGRKYLQEKSQLNLVGIRPPDGAAQLANGSIGTAVLWEPHLSRAQQVDGVEILRSPGLYEFSVCLISTRVGYTNKKTAIDRLISSIKKASQVASSNPEKFLSGLQGHVPNKTLKEAKWETVDFTIVQNKALVSERLKREITSLREAGLLTSDVDISGLVSALN